MTRWLLIDDEPRVAKALRYAVSGSDIELTFESDPARALAVAGAARPDAILLDIDLAGADGLEVCRALKGAEATRHVPILLLSGHVDDQTKEAGFAAGADDFVTKPFAPGDLIARVEAHVRRSRA
ncbi:MAG TPA: response regulator transcription factor [Candidatus Limnocylindria bacterium]